MMRVRVHTHVLGTYVRYMLSPTETRFWLGASACIYMGKEGSTVLLSFSESPSIHTRYIVTLPCAYHICAAQIM